MIQRVLNLLKERKQKEKPSELKIICPGVFKSVLSSIAATSHMQPLFKVKLIRIK